MYLRVKIAFYNTTRLYHSILDVHGWRAMGETIAEAFKRGDFAAMSAAVTDELIDQIAIACRPDEARDRLKQWEAFGDQVLLYPATVGAAPGRVRENVAAITDTFGR